MTVTSTSPQPLTRAPASNETPVYLPAGEEHVFGVLTAPVGVSNGTAVLCLHAGAQNLSSHRNGLFTRWCREIAALGYTAFRMDFHGSGDASGVLADRDVSGQTSADVDAAVQWLVSRGAERVVIVGTCWGGLVALLAATRHTEIVSALLISPALRPLDRGGSVTKPPAQKHARLGQATVQLAQPDVLKLVVKDATYRRWVLKRARNRAVRSLAPQVARVRRRLPRQAAPPPPSVPTAPVSPLAQLVERKLRVHALFGEDERTYREFKAGTMPTLEAASDVLDVAVAPVSVHGLSTLRAQELALEHLHRWLALDTDATRHAPA